MQWCGLFASDKDIECNEEQHRYCLCACVNMCEERMRLRRSRGFVLGRHLLSKLRDAALVEHGQAAVRLVVYCAVQLYRHF